MAGLKTVLFLSPSNIFMTFAWDAHPKDEISRKQVGSEVCLTGAVFLIFRR